MADIPTLLWPELESADRRLRISGDPHHHLCRVLRLRVGDAIELRDGRGAVASASIAELERNDATLEVGELSRPAQPFRQSLALALPLLKSKRLDWVIEKGTELGVGAFRLYIGRHSVVRRSKSPARYRELIASAFCQSRGLLLPELSEPVPFAALLADARASALPLYWADERLAGQAGESITPAELGGAERLAWIGPEGGFSEGERDALVEAGATALSLGPQRLRSETAAIAMACRFLLPSGAT